MLKKKINMKKLLEDFKKKWIDALRSGKYKQGTGTLIKKNDEDENIYYCLGIAAIVCGIENEELTNYDFIPYDFKFDCVPELIRGEDY